LWISLLAVGVIASLLVACGGGDDDLQPADEVLGETQEAQTDEAADIGELLDLNDLRVAVQAVQWAERPDRSEETWALVSVRVENPSDEEAMVEFDVTCAPPATAGWYLYEGPGSIENSAAVPPGSFDEGDILFGIDPGECRDMVISASQNGVFYGEDDPEEVRWRGPAPGEPTVTIEE